jgi:hypothetical protein
MIDKVLTALARLLGRPITVPDGDGGRITYFPGGGWSHKL